VRKPGDGSRLVECDLKGFELEALAWHARLAEKVEKEALGSIWMFRKVAYGDP
jgi:hypothetical protein